MDKIRSLQTTARTMGPVYERILTGLHNNTTGWSIQIDLAEQILQSGLTLVSLVIWVKVHAILHNEPHQYMASVTVNSELSKPLYRIMHELTWNCWRSSELQPTPSGLLCLDIPRCGRGVENSLDQSSGWSPTYQASCETLLSHTHTPHTSVFTSIVLLNSLLTTSTSDEAGKLIFRRDSDKEVGWGRTVAARPKPLSVFGTKFGAQMAGPGLRNYTQLSVAKDCEGGTYNWPVSPALHNYVPRIFKLYACDLHGREFSDRREEHHTLLQHLLCNAVENGGNNRVTVTVAVSSPQVSSPPLPHRSYRDCIVLRNTVLQYTVSMKVELASDGLTSRHLSCTTLAEERDLDETVIKRTINDGAFINEGCCRSCWDILQDYVSTGRNNLLISDVLSRDKFHHAIMYVGGPDVFTTSNYTAYDTAVLGESELINTELVTSHDKVVLRRFQPLTPLYSYTSSSVWRMECNVALRLY
ncbi:hypothetical protein J6590_012992 [Homalodisca vitripennis]|nr:hypothetical protein J6590_012992 [Homalodisca vitripennis]